VDGIAPMYVPVCDNSCGFLLDVHSSSNITCGDSNYGSSWVLSFW